MIFSDRLQNIYDHLNQSSGNRLDILKKSFESFTEARGAQAAASMAYYAFFSLFPLLLVLISAAGYFLQNQQAYDRVIQLVKDALPVSQQLINQNLQRVIHARGAIGAIGLLSLLWSASGVFTTLAYNINLAWPEAFRRSFLQKRLVALGMIGVLGILMFLSIFLQAILTIINQTNIPSISSLSIQNSWFWPILSNLPALFIMYLLFFALYHWVPTRNVSIGAALWSALVVTIGWKIVAGGFSWYLSSGLSSYELVYGSLGTVVALLFLIYIMSWIVLYGAHLSAAIDWWKENQKQNN
jgi:membrane protein